MNHLKDIIISLRPYQWSKNILLFAGVFFSLSLFEFPLLLKATYGFISFIMASSSVYLFNDLVDTEKDRLHPVKKFRPIPSGRVSRKEAILLSVLLFAFSVFIGAFLINSLFTYIIITYILINIGYTCCLKNIVILDVFIVSVGFLLRTAAGIIAVDVAFSPWIIIATFLLALLLVIGKRRGELVNLKEEAVQHRQALENYSVIFIDNLLNIITAAAIVTYALYTIAEETIERFQTQMLIITTPVIIYVLFRYLYLLQLKNQGEDPINMVIRDKHLVIGGGVWVLMVAFIIYLKFVLKFSI